MQSNPRVAPTLVDEPVSIEEIDVQVVEPTTPAPPIIRRIARQTAYYTVNAVLEPQEPRYSALCVLLSLLFVGGFLLMVKRC